MTLYEGATASISFLALVISFVALVRSRNNQKRLLELEEINASLSQAQLEKMRLDAENDLKANLSVSLEGSGSSYKFIVSNSGPASASDIHFSLEGDLEHFPLVGGDYEQKLTYPALEADDYYYLVASFPLSVTQNIYRVALRWKNSDGTSSVKEFTVSR